ncbi:elongation factor 1-gamma 2 [Monosporozyma servazzii]
MSQGTLFVSRSPRCIPALAIIEHFNLDVEIVNVKTTAHKDFDAKFPLKQVPSFLGPKGLRLTENAAISTYLIDLLSEKDQKILFGATPAEKIQVLRYHSIGNSNLFAYIGLNFLMVTGSSPFNKKTFDAHMESIETYAKVFDERLKDYTFVATENVSIADIQCLGAWSLAFASVCGAEFRKAHPYLMRWFKTVLASPIVAKTMADYKMVEEPLKYVPPKKEKKEKKEQQPKKKEAKKEEAPAEAAPEKKPKHPLELLGKSTFVLDEWKRKYSNDDTRPVALPWFWEHYNPEEYSLWKVEYKYNDELTLTFMSNNLIGGFFNRLTGSTKYMFGAMVVYGENNDNGIVGACMVRGQEAPPAFDVAPDWESYSYVKLDHTNEEDREFVNNMWAWDKPVVVNGQNKEIVDGKVLK